jgi:hypothetical protein
VCADLEAFILSPEQLMRRATPRLARPVSCSSTNFRHLVNCPRRLFSLSMHAGEVQAFPRAPAGAVRRHVGVADNEMGLFSC